MFPESRTLALAAAIAVMAPAGAAMAGDWELEIHGGGLLSVMPSSGRATPPPPGETFQTVVPEVSGRRITSWYYGEGGMLIRQTRIGWAVGAGNYAYQYPITVGPIDPVLSGASVGRPLGGLAGLRLGRRLGRRVTAELNLDYGSYAPAFSKTARANIETSRSAFESAWSNVLSSLPGSSVTSRATLLEGRGRQLVATGVLNVNLATGDAPKWSRRSPRRRFVSYLTLGAGIVSTEGEEASATLVGRYQFASPLGESGARFDETDTATIRSSASFGTAFVGVLGLGWKQDLSTRWGMRLDARVYLSRKPTRIVLDARPSVTTGSPAAAFVVDSRIGAIQFVNDGSGAYAGQQSSLSGPPITGFETFRGSGILTQINVTLGAFLRF